MNFEGAKVSGKDVEYWNANSNNVQDGETYTIRWYLHKIERLIHGIHWRIVLHSIQIQID